MKKIICLLTGVFVLLSLSVQSQVYIKKQTRHRFAQLNFGIGLQSSFGGETSYFDQQGNIQTLSLDNFYSPKLMVGGTHFWGHADFYIAIPLFSSDFRAQGQEVFSLSGVETVFKYYPWRIENKKIRPFIGTALTPFYYEQDNELYDFGDGPDLNHTSFPLYTGFTYNSKNSLFELGLMWNYNNTQEYRIGRNTIVDIQTPPLYLNFSYRYMLETTLSAEKSWDSGRTEQITQKLAEANKLNSIYLGVGLSSAFWLKESSYNQNNRPYIEKYSTSIMPDFTLGYYLHKPDMNFALSYRRYGTSSRTYGAVHSLNRRSFVFEATKFLFDYNGFAFFVGPAISQERLSFTETFEREVTFDESVDKMAYGLTFGWDIRPNRIQTWILRTNLRWFPSLELDLDNDNAISFDNIEFNFIQLIIYPTR
ncbi:MAG: hypothetical protein AAFO07_20440 [Bacteroidota bacterium]